MGFDARDYIAGPKSPESKESHQEDPYRILGISSTASESDAKQARNRIAKELNSASVRGDAAALAKLQKANLAYDTIADPVRLALYKRGQVALDGGRIIQPSQGEPAPAPSSAESELKDFFRKYGSGDTR